MYMLFLERTFSNLVILVVVISSGHASSSLLFFLFAALASHGLLGGVVDHHPAPHARGREYRRARDNQPPDHLHVEHILRLQDHLAAVIRLTL